MSHDELDRSRRAAAEGPAQELKDGPAPSKVRGPKLPSGLSAATFNEVWYLSRYPDVRQAVEKGTFKSAFEHYCVAGLREQRDYRSYVENALNLMALEHAPFRHLFYKAASAGHVPAMQRGEALKAYLVRTFQKQEMIHE